MRIFGINHAQTFTRRLRADEEQDYKKTIQQAKEQLGLKNVAMIIHGSAFPSDGLDAYIGSPYDNESREFIKFINLHGFNNVQLGPAGKISRQNISPYESSVFAKNHLFIDLKPLTTEEYANILSKNTLLSLSEDAPKNKNKNYTYAKFYEAFESYDIAMDEAFENFKNKVKLGDKNALKLNHEFNAFKTKASDWLEKDGIFAVLANMYGTEDFEKWENPIDRNLAQLLEKNHPSALKRYEKIKLRAEDKIEKNSFIQFLAHKQLEAHHKFRKNIGFSYINDLLVGFSMSDMWANQEAFLNDWRMGCPYGGKNNGMQYWDIPVLNPNKLYNEDGSLGIAGKLLKQKIDASLEGFDNIRIDHALGLVDPFIYHNKNPEIRGNISKLNGIDDGQNFRELLEKIIFPTLQSHSVDINDAVWEDVCSSTDVFDYMYHYKYKLPGLTQLQWMKAENCNPNNWTLIGSHDSIPAAQMDINAWDKNYLAGYLNADPQRAEARNEFRAQLEGNPQKILSAKFAELFRATKNIQISFADFFGIDKTYNYGGQKVDTNWKLRMNENYQDTYYKALEDDKPNTLCMPEVLKIAVQAKIDMTIAKTSDKNNSLGEQLRNKTRKALYEQWQPLLDKLDMYAKILREKE